MGRLVLGAIELTGFMSYGQESQTFVFGGQGPVAVVGTNGSGKSSGVSRGLTWCLYGKCPPERMGTSTRMLKGRGIVNEDSKQAVVSVRLFRPDKPKKGYIVTRTRTRSKSDIVEVTTLKSKKVGNDQKTEDALIGAGYDTFVRTVVRGQNDVWNFAEATDTRKREIIDAISGSEVLVGSYDVARQKAKSKATQADSLGKRADDAERRVSAYDISALVRKSSEWDAEHARRVATADGEVSSLRKQLEAARTEDIRIADIELERATLEANEPTLDMTPYQDAVNGAITSLSAARAMLNRAKDEKRQIDSLKPGKPCPMCGEKVGKGAAKKLKTIDSGIPALSEQVEAEQKFKNDAQTASTEASQWLEHERKAWKARLSGLVVRQPQTPLIDGALKSAEGRLADLKAANNPHSSTIEQAQAQLYGLQREIAWFRSLERHYRYDALIAQSWVELLSPKGVRAAIGDSVLAAIEAGANSWLTTLSDGRMSVEFRPIKKTASGEKRDIQTIVYVKKDDGSVKQRNILNFSGGERRRINIAVDLGVAAAFSRGGSLSLSLLVLDEEVFSGLDEQGKVGVANAIHRSGVADVVVIDHDPSLSGSLPRVIKVIREHNGSKVQHEDPRN